MQVAALTPARQQLDLTTWSVAAAEPHTGDVGVALASCVPLHADALAALVPGRGAALTQGAFDLSNRNAVYRALVNGLSAEEVVSLAASRDADPDQQRRQYGVVTIDGQGSHAATFTSAQLDGLGLVSDRHSVAVQGNTLVDPRVVEDTLRAFVGAGLGSQPSLPDRLMGALEAGSRAGGDARCQDPEGNPQTAASAFIAVARGGDPPYAACAVGATDQLTDRSPWLALSVVRDLGGANAVEVLRGEYDRWRSSAGG